MSQPLPVFPGLDPLHHATTYFRFRRWQECVVRLGACWGDGRNLSVAC